MNIDESQLTRLSVIDETGLVLERVGLTVQMLLQDDDRTLKIFIKSDNPEAAQQYRESFAQDVSRIFSNEH